MVNLKQKTLKKENELMIASQNGQRDVAKFFIDMGVDVNAKDKNGWTALMHAISSKMYHSGDHIGVINLLIASHADLNLKSNNGYTALMLASIYGEKEVVVELLNGGANVNVKNNEGNTALMCALSREHFEIVKLLEDAGAKYFFEG